MTEEEIREALPEFSLTIQGDETHPIISNFDDLKEWTDKAVAYATGQMVSTEAKDLKPIRAQLNRLQMNLEDARKALKRRMEAPYKEWETQYKDAISSLVGAIDEIGTMIRAQETKERDERLMMVERIIKSKADAISVTLYPITQKVEVRSWFFEKEWENKSTSKATIEKRIASQLQTLLSGMAAAKVMAKPDVAMNAFLSTGDVMKAQEASDKAMQLGEMQKAAPVIPNAAEKMQPVAPDRPAPMPEELVPPPGKHSLSIEVPDELPEDEAKIIRIHRTISGPKGHIRILLDVAKSLGLELVKIKRE